MAPWWGAQAVPLDENRFWQIGPCRLWAQHRLYQWQLAWQYESNWLTPGVQVNVPPGGQRPEPSGAAARVHCAYRESVNELSFSPALADRSLVTKLEHPLRVLPGENIALYVCSPLWLKIEATQPPKAMLEIPLFRLSDTWFGQVGQPGEVCYASRVPVYLQLKDVPLRLHCAITAVTVRNNGVDSLTVERLNLPMPRLALFYSRRSGFWTESLELERTEGPEHAVVHSNREPPPEAAPHQLISPSRRGSVEERTVVRAFSGLFK